MVNWKLIGAATVCGNLLALNMLFWLGWKNLNSREIANGAREIVSDCGVECRAEVARQVALLREQLQMTAEIYPVPTLVISPTISAPTTKPETVVKVVVPTRAKQRSTTYITIPGNGISRMMEWDSLSGTEFYFDKRDYPGLVEAYFEVNMKLVNGNGMGYVRLYDATHNVGVQGGEVQSKSQSGELVSSGKVNFWDGKNLIKVQAKTLTADTTVYSYGRLKVVTEN